MLKLFSGFILIVIFTSSCKKEGETYDTVSLTDYYPLEVGKTITYDLDSIVYYINFGQRESIIHYQVQDRVDAQIQDNLGRTAYRIIRFIRKNENQAWQPDNTFVAVPTGNSIEFVENNLRFLKLQQPVKQDFSWKGNSYIDTYTTFTDLRYLDKWDYIYDSVNVPLTINSLSFDSTIKILQRDEFLGQDPSVPGTQYAEKNYAVEKYAAGVGLIYKEFVHWEYQGPSNQSPGYSGYGVRLSIIDHN
jgi:hypothetical protein